MINIPDIVFWIRVQFSLGLTYIYNVWLLLHHRTGKSKNALMTNIITSNQCKKHDVHNECMIKLVQSIMQLIITFNGKIMTKCYSMNLMLIKIHYQNIQFLHLIRVHLFHHILQDSAKARATAPFLIRRIGLMLVFRWLCHGSLMSYKKTHYFICHWSQILLQ